MSRSIIHLTRQSLTFKHGRRLLNLERKQTTLCTIQPLSFFKDAHVDTDNKNPTQQLQTRYFSDKDVPPSSVSNDTNDTNSTEKVKKPKKESFAEKFLEPAARGELVGHSSGIPKLAVRKKKGQGVMDDYPGKVSKQPINYYEMSKMSEKAAIKRGERRNGGGEDGRSTGTGSLQRMVRQVTRQRRQRKEDTTNKSRKSFNKKKKPKDETNDETNELINRFNEPTFKELNHNIATKNNLEFVGRKIPPNVQFRQQRHLKNRRQTDKVFDFWGNVIPQKELDDPWLSDTISITYNHTPPESRRQPRPRPYPISRRSPPKEFVKSHGVFAYVTNIPCTAANKKVETEDTNENDKINEEIRMMKTTERKNFDNPIHRQEVAEFVAETFNLPVTTVVPATLSSAFIGFADGAKAAEVFIKNKRRMLWNKEKLTLTLCNTKKDELIKNASSDDPSDLSKQEKNFIAWLSSSDDSSIILRLDNIPAGMKAHTIIHSLHGILDLDSNDAFFLSPTNALLRLSSTIEGNEDINTLLQSPKLQSCLTMMGRQTLHVQAAHREIIHNGFEGPVNFYEKKKLSDTRPLVVDGDVPSKEFYLSHANVLQIINVPSSVTPNMISWYFQKYCEEKRDVIGSVEIVKTIDGKPTGRVYVGFDYIQDYDRACEDLSKASYGIYWQHNDNEQKHKKGSPSIVKLISEKNIINGSKFGHKSYRSEEELWDNLHNAWKKYVDPKDIAYLESKGVSRDVLEDAFMTVRFKNPTFGVEDQARVGEKLREGYEPGQHFREFVETYVETLKECASTKEDPGMFYNAMFFPDEEVDYELFDSEEERLEKIKNENFLE